EVPTGSTFGLIGENGSGKSTLLKCMARILRPDKGRTNINGKVSALLEVGAGFHPELSGRDNVYLNGSILGLSKKELDSKFDAIGTVRTLCDHVALLDHGVLKEVGPAAEVIDRYVVGTHVDHVVDAGGGQRWGSGEGRIERVELLNAAGNPVLAARTGDRITFRMHYATTEPIERPVF